MRTDVSVAHVIVNNLGGITSLVQNLILYKGDDALPQKLLLLDIAGNTNTAAIIDKDIRSEVTYFSLHPSDNWYYTYGKLAAALSKTEGVLVSNDQYDLIMLQAFNIRRKVVQLVHDSYNVELSIRFHECIDLFIAHSRYIYELLVQRFPERSDHIVHLPYGIPIAKNVQKKFNQHEPLKLLFLGRHDKAKGVYDLFEINRLLQEEKIPVEWIILGRGPETGTLKEQWKRATNVTFCTPATTAEVLEKALNSDVLVFPTKFEGFPVALLETMSMGCVPVVTDLPGGIRELVEDGVTGYKCSMDENELFAGKISLLHHDRVHLRELQINAMQKVAANYNAEIQMPAYQEAFLRLLEEKEPPHHHRVNLKIGSRLDQKWIPNFVTSVLRSLT
ncbi:MAG: glycosyltransferase [Chitinophagaceae bacterium]|nr:glycosyltransferase [Chitinophagaceae bacterium]